MSVELCRNIEAAYPHRTCTLNSLHGGRCNFAGGVRQLLGTGGPQSYPMLDLGADRNRVRPCTRRTWCTLPVHDATKPCEEVLRAPIAPSDFGPKAASSTRRGG